MFTGIIEAIGTIQNMQPKGGDMRLTIHTGKLDMSDVALGDSIAVNGVCLTAIEYNNHSFTADVSNETLSLTSLGQLSLGSEANLEKALTLQTRLGGHMVSGHVDGLGEVVKLYDDGRSVRFHIKAPDELAKYIADKGSICVDGVSLTVNKIDGSVFELNIVPHTIEETIIKHYSTGTKMNLEVDVIARYLERLLMGTEAPKTTGITQEFLAENGFLK
ncbi:MAG: riboflavin synthase [Thiotrichaceae bacterium]